MKSPREFFIGLLAGSLIVLFLFFEIGLIWPADTSILPSKKTKPAETSSSVKTSSPSNQPISLPGGEKFVMILSSDELGKLYREVIAYHDLLESMKWLIPALASLFVTLGIAAGTHYVKSSVHDAKESVIKQVKEELLAQLNRHTEKAEAALKDAAETYKTTAGGIKVRQSLMSAAVNHSHSLFYWLTMKDYENAMVYARIALNRVEAINPDDMPLLSDEERRSYQRDKTYIEGDLAYYYTLLYKKTSSPENAKKTLEYARRAYAGLERLPESSKVGQVDNFLYAIANVKPITNDDFEKGKALYSNYKDMLSELLVDINSRNGSKSTTVPDRGVDDYGNFFTQPRINAS